MVKPTNFDELYPGRFLKAGHLQGKQVTVTIQDVHLEELESDKGVEQKAIITMKDKKLQLVLCKLNGLCLKAMFGPSISAWIGKRITLWPTDTIVPMKRGEACIRVWGSPDILQDITIPIKLQRRKAFNISLRRSLGAAVVAPPTPLDEPPPPSTIDDTGWPEA